VNGPQRLAALGCALWLAAAADLMAQPIQLDGRFAMTGHGATDCVNNPTTSGLSAGLEMRTTGRFFASAAADVFFKTGYGCLEHQRILSYAGQSAVPSGSSRFTSPRASVGLGTSTSGESTRYETAVGVGVVRTSTRFEANGRIAAWQPWYSATLTVRWVSSGFGLQLEAGQHRIPERFYSSDAQETLLAEWQRWRPLIRLGATYSLVD
jgi:hypothetical protein